MKFTRKCGKCHEDLEHWRFINSKSFWCRRCVAKYTSNFLPDKYIPGRKVYSPPDSLSVSFTSHCQRFYKLLVKKVRTQPEKYHIDDFCCWESFFEYCKLNRKLTRLIDTWAKSGYRSGLAPSIIRSFDTIGFSIANISFITMAESMKKCKALVYQAYDILERDHLTK